MIWSAPHSELQYPVQSVTAHGIVNAVLKRYRGLAIQRSIEILLQCWIVRLESSKDFISSSLLLVSRNYWRLISGQIMKRTPPRETDFVLKKTDDNGVLLCCLMTKMLKINAVVSFELHLMRLIESVSSIGKEKLANDLHF